MHRDFAPTPAANQNAVAELRERGTPTPILDVEQARRAGRLGRRVAEAQTPTHLDQPDQILGAADRRSPPLLPRIARGKGSRPRACARVRATAETIGHDGKACAIVWHREPSVLAWQALAMMRGAAHGTGYHA